MSLPSIFASRTLPWVLLALSVALNAFFIGGHLYTRSYWHHSRGYEERTSALSKRLGLDDQQRTAFRESRKSLGPKFRELRKEARPHVDKLWDEMTKPTPDQAVIDAELKALNDMRLQFDHEALASAATFMKTLKPEQRQAFADYARKRFPGPPEIRDRQSPPREGPEK